MGSNRNRCLPDGGDGVSVGFRADECSHALSAAATWYVPDLDLDAQYRLSVFRQLAVNSIQIFPLGPGNDHCERAGWKCALRGQRTRNGQAGNGQNRGDRQAKFPSTHASLHQNS